MISLQLHLNSRVKTLSSCTDEFGKVVFYKLMMSPEMLRKVNMKS